jgi:quinol monooxygenase YgiN
LVTVIFRAKMKEGKEDQAIDAMKRMAAAVESGESDTLIYTICRNQEDPSELLVIECYKDDAAFQTHMGTSHMGDMRATFGDLFEPSGVKLERVERLAGFARG